MNQLPPTNDLAAAIKCLPKPRPGVTPQVVDLSASQQPGSYRVTFIVRRNVLPEVHAWFWGIAGSERLHVGDCAVFAKPLQTV